MLKDTIISAFNYDGTLLKWLKKVQEALENASASEFRVNKKGNATISFSIVFANGDTLESGDIILQQGESVTGATIRQGHLILTLSNGDELDAGDLGAVTGFSINGSQHLIVTYQNGTTQDLGAIFTGNVTISGAITSNTEVNTPVITSNENEITAQKPIIQPVNDITITPNEIDDEKVKVTHIYNGVNRNGNQLQFVLFFKITNKDISGPGAPVSLCTIKVPANIGSRLTPTIYGSLSLISEDAIGCFKGVAYAEVFMNAALFKYSNTSLECILYKVSALEQNTEYVARYTLTLNL